MSPMIHATVIPISEVPLEENDGSMLNHLPILLVVDDEHVVADTLAIIFKRAGYCALRAYDAAGALEIASAIMPDLLVTDVRMPLMNGIELALALRNRYPDCGVLLLSGHATHSDLASARLSGHDFPLLTKPVHPDELLRKVSACLGTRSSTAGAPLNNLRQMPTPQRASA